MYSAATKEKRQSVFVFQERSSIDSTAKKREIKVFFSNFKKEAIDCSVLFVLYDVRVQCLCVITSAP